ncbi:MAG TPA: efflux RND transporter periplasmic adaptor subunit [Nitrospirota bacterium]|nr:efflux RND transporter periplasmic adaptor subunit [Nitrospirota bacterium]
MSIVNGHTRHTRCAFIGIVIMMFVLGVKLSTHLFYSTSQAAEQETIPPALVRQGDQFIIPEGSALRSRLLVQQVAVDDSPHTLVSPAVVEADPARTVNILPPLAGRVVNLVVRLGDHVVKGDPVVAIDSGDLGQAYADDDKARDALQHAERTLERVRGLHDAGAGSLKDLEQAESDYAQAKAEFRRAESRLEEIGVPSQPKDGLRLLTLTAPTTGSVTALTTAPGAFVNDLTASLMTIANLGSVWVTANVPEMDIAHIAKGQSVDVSFAAYPGQVFHGTVAFVSDVVEPETRRSKVRIVFSNPDGKFKPNMFANVSFNVPQKSEVFVPNSALLMDNDSTVVFVEVAPWTFIKRPVLPGYEKDDGARIDQGLKPGDRIIVKGGVLLND